MSNILQVYREGVIVSTFNIDESTIFIDKLHLERKITCPVSSKDALQLEEGDYITHEDGEVYIINNLPDFEKDGGKLQKSYNIVFESEFYLLLDTYVINDFQQKEFPKYGTAQDHLDFIFANANRNDTGWIVGEVDTTESQLINYNWTYVRTALNEIAETFKLEWSFSGRTIKMVSTIGRDTGLTFEVGRGKGLHQIKRSKDTSKSVVTRVFGVGGSRNIDYTYRDGVERNLIFEGRYVETPGVTAGTERVREGKYTNEELYPRFDGVVGSVVVNKDGAGLISSVVITDAAIDFDINAHLMEGEKAIVSFRTGSLTGAEFEIYNYNHATKAIELIPASDTNGYVLPNDLNMAVIGDQFTLLNLRMPTAYIATWEAKLRTETLQYLEDNCKARLLFGVIPDERHLRANNIQLKVGDRGTVIETDAQVNEILRFTEISYPLVNKFKVTAVIGNEIRYDRVVKLFADTIQTRKDVQTIDRRSAELAKRGVQNLRALESSIFDTDGKIKEERIDVGVLSALLGIFGAKSQNFKLNQVYITDNYAGDNSKVFISGGELIHFEISNPGNANIWTMTSLLTSGLVAASLYYVYAKCSVSAQVGSWVVTTAQIKPEDEPGYYHFLTGVVYPVLDGWRNSDFTNGIADINGNRLKIGKIASRDGLTSFDLDSGEILGKITFKTGSTGYNNIADKPDLSVFATQDFVDSIKDDLQGQIDGSITTWFFGNVPTLTNEPANGWPTVELKNNHLGDLFYNTSTGYAYRFQLSAGVYSWEKITDTDITLALSKAQHAQDTADSKRQVFTVQPYTPYDIGDLWTQGVSGELMRCIVARPSGAYNASDWGLASKYTDDTSANNVQLNLNTLSGSLGGLAYDSIVEKAKLGPSIMDGAYFKNELIETNTLIIRGNLETTFGSQTKADQARIDAVSLAKSYTSGKAYAGGKMLYRDPEFVDGTWNSMGVYNNSSNPSVSFYTLDSYQFGGNLPNSSGKAIGIKYAGGDVNPGLGGFMWANPSRPSGIWTYRILAYIPIGYTLNWAANAFGDGSHIEWNTSTKGTGKWEEYIVTAYAGATGTFSLIGYFYLTSDAGLYDPVDWYLAYATVFDMTAAEVDYLKEANAAADLANAAQTDADAALGRISNMIADGVFDAVEKKEEFKNWEKIEAENTNTISQAVYYGLDYSAYTYAKDQLAAFLNPYFQNFNIDEPVDRALFTTTFDTLYASRQELLSRIAKAAKDASSIKVFPDGTTLFSNNFSFQGSGLETGYLIIHTNIHSNNTMYAIDIKGYNFAAGKSRIDLSVGFYANSVDNGNTFSSSSFVSKGDFKITKVQLIRSTAGTVDIIIGTDATRWEYADIVVDRIKVSYSPAEIDVEKGWSRQFSTVIPAYEIILDIPGSVAETVEGSTTKSAAAEANALYGAAQAATIKMNDAITAANGYTDGQVVIARDDAIDAAALAQSNLVSQLKGMAYEEKVEFAKFGDTVAEGAFLKTILINTIELQALVVTTDYLESLEIVVYNLKTSATGQRIEIAKATNNLVFYDTYEDDLGVIHEYENFKLDGAIDSTQSGRPLGGIRMNTPDDRVSYATGNGFFSNGGNMTFFPLSVGFPTNASVVGLLFDRNSDVNGISAGVVGRDATPVDKGTYNAATVYKINDCVIYGGSKWKYIYSTPYSGLTPAEGSFWTAYSGYSKTYAGYFIGSVEVSKDLNVRGNLNSFGASYLNATNLNIAGTAGNRPVMIDASGFLYRG